MKFSNSPMYAIAGFGPGDIWFGTTAPHHWDGKHDSVYNVNGLFEATIFKLWRTSSQDLYAMGNNGAMLHYDGISFTGISTGVKSRFSDLYGEDGKVYVVSYYYDNQILPSGVFLYQQQKFAFLFPTTTDPLPFRNLLDSFGVWVSPTGVVWVVTGTNVFRPFLDHTPIPGINLAQYSTSCIRGTSASDVWIAGGLGFVLHYNGYSWKD
jgi:hypothetical protein